MCIFVFVLVCLCPKVLALISMKMSSTLGTVLFCWLIMSYLQFCIVNQSRPVWSTDRTQFLYMEAFGLLKLLEWFNCFQYWIHYCVIMFNRLLTSIKQRSASHFEAGYSRPYFKLNSLPGMEIRNYIWYEGSIELTGFLNNPLYSLLGKLVVQPSGKKNWAAH